MSTDKSDSLVKMELINRLVQDFKDTTPNYTRAECRELQLRLHGFTIDDLRLLVSQIEKVG